MIETREATTDDIDVLLENLSAGFESYAEFAPAGWVPPEPDRDLTLDELREPDTWALLATVDGRPAGHVAFIPSRGDPFAGENWREGPPNPGEAHLWQLFVLPDYWGAGVGPLLHGAAVDAMRERGYDRARLLTPEAHSRARRFYEQRGWRSGRTLRGDLFGLPLLVYRLDLAQPPSAD